MALTQVAGPLMAQQARETLPRWIDLDQPGSRSLRLAIPADLDRALPDRDIDYLLIEVDSGWAPAWKDAAFKLKSLIVTLKTRGAEVAVGMEAAPQQIDALLEHELAAYIDGYVFTDDPYIPEADETGKLWQRVEVPKARVLQTLVEASSLGISHVLFENIDIDDTHDAFLKTISATRTGSLDVQPELANMPSEEAVFFFDPDSGNYHLGVYGDAERDRLFSFRLAEGLKPTLLHPEKADFRHKQYGRLSEFRLSAGEPYYFFVLEPSERSGTMESIEIVEQKSIDPYELVVKNQVFKDRERQKFESLVVLEKQNYRYQAASGATIDVTFYDTLVLRKDRPAERIRKELYFGGVKWPYSKLPELPLIQPEKLQSAPMDIDLDKSYAYSYAGEDTIDGFKTWKVRFQPKSEGDFLSGTVWFDQETGAHRRIRAIQNGLEPPVIGNEMIADFDWVEDDGERFWVQVGERNLQIINVVGETIPLQIDTKRSEYQFNASDVDHMLADAYQGDYQILRDTVGGFRYLKLKDGKRVLQDDTVPPQKFLLGGVFMEPSLDFPLPLGGFNYTDLDFMDRGWQANFFVAGLINDLIVSNPDFLGMGWDLTAEVFASAVRFGDEFYVNNEEDETQEVENLRESFNLTLGIPLNSFFKFSANYSLAYNDYSDADDTSEDFVLPSSHFENIGRVGLKFNRGRFVSELQYEFVKRSEWEAWGLPDNTEPLEDSYRTLQFDASLSRRLKGFQSIQADVRYLKGWDQDRFSRFEFGFFENRVSGFGSAGIEADEAVRLRFEYDVGIKDILQFSVSLDGARTWRDLPDESGVLRRADPVDLYGIGLAANFIGPFRTIMRFDVGYGIDSDLEDEAGKFTGQIVFLRIF
ncbi:hypothetical protein [Sulfidibacter corallicola]